jgi:hypothetical protein
VRDSKPKAHLLFPCWCAVPPEVAGGWRGPGPGARHSRRSQGGGAGALARGTNKRQNPYKGEEEGSAGREEEQEENARKQQEVEKELEENAKQELIRNSEHQEGAVGPMACRSHRRPPFGVWRLANFHGVAPLAPDRVGDRPC